MLIRYPVRVVKLAIMTLECIHSKQDGDTSTI